ncbi:MAG: hypothetical protein WDN76_08030, partial [Alphaproteobacteria bacterium]
MGGVRKSNDDDPLADLAIAFQNRRNRAAEQIFSPVRLTKPGDGLAIGCEALCVLDEHGCNDIGGHKQIPAKTRH